MSRFRLMLAESVNSLMANISTTFAATVTVLIGMFLLGLVIALGTWGLSFSEYAKNRLEVKVLFCTELDVADKKCKAVVTPQQINAVSARLDSEPLRPLIKDVEFVSKAEALNRMRRQRPDLVRDLVSNPLPPAFEITPRDGADVKTIAAALRDPKPAGVQRIRDGEEISDRILTAAKVISTAAAAATVILLIASVLLIANTIRLSIFSRRREIEVMKLVGATNWFVRGPFMLEGLICGLVGSVAAVIFLLLAKELVLPSILNDVESGSSVEAVAFGLNALVIVVIGLLVGVLGSGLTLRRFLQV